MHGQVPIARPPRWLVVLVALVVSGPSVRGEVTPPTRIAEFIDQLGSAEFSARERAEAALRQLGLAAYPALSDAAHHDDLEIRLRARAILVDLREKHLLADVDPAVARIMQNYATLPLEVRRERVEQLTTILPQQGIELVARLTQFEEDQALAEAAVTALLGCRLPSSLERQRELAEPVLDQLGNTSRQAARWLRAWALMIQSPQDAVDVWKTALDDLEQPNDAWPPRDPEQDFAIRRCYLDTLARAGRREEAAAFADETTDWVQNHEDFHLPWVSWLVDHDQWQAAIAFQKQHPDAVAQDPRLLLPDRRSHGEDGSAGGSASFSRSVRRRQLASRGSLDGHLAGSRTRPL